MLKTQRPAVPLWSGKADADLAGERITSALTTTSTNQQRLIAYQVDANLRVVSAEFAEPAHG
jgi:hypothetical protein